MLTSTTAGQTGFTKSDSLIAGTYYHFKVKAKNSMGFSDHSIAISIVAATVSDPPYALAKVSSTKTTITVLWTAPFDGGTPIDDY